MIAQLVWYLEIKQSQKMFSLLGRSLLLLMSRNVVIWDLCDWTYFYKNVEVKINQNLKNVLRVFLKMSVDLERFYFANLYINWQS